MYLPSNNHPNWVVLVEYVVVQRPVPRNGLWRPVHGSEAERIGALQDVQIAREVVVALDTEENVCVCVFETTGR